MTAVAGCIGAPVHLLERYCSAALDRQRAYADRPSSLRCLDGAAFGIALRETLPEDSFDRQPYASARFLFVADARIDNRRELTASLGLSASAELSDSEIFFLAWERWQESSLDRIAGDFALAVLDRDSETLTLARDPTGQRPLHYACTAAVTAAFASMPSGLFDIVRPTPDLEQLARRLQGPWTHAGSCFEAIKAVSPGHLVRISRTGETSARRFWSPALSVPVGEGPDLLDRFRELLDTAVQERSRRVGGPLAAHLSSGIDSSAVFVSAARLSADPVIALTAAPALDIGSTGPRGRPTDESAIAALTAGKAGAEHVVVRDARPLIDTVRQHSRFGQEPVRNPYNFGWWSRIAEEAQERQAKVLLTGELGNFGVSAGGLWALSEWIRLGQFRTWWAEARAAGCRPDVNWRGVAFSSLEPWVPPRLKALLQRQLQDDFSSAGAFVRRRWRQRRPAGWLPHPRSRAEERLERVSSIDFGPLRKATLARYGIDERDPTSDRRLLEFCLSLGPRNHLRDGRMRPFARSALADRLGPEVLDVPLRAYQGGDALARMSTSALHSAIEEVSASGAARELLKFDRLRRAAKLLSDLPPSSTRAASLGRAVTEAIAAGLFVLEVQKDPGILGR